jgi:transposase
MATRAALVEAVGARYRNFTPVTIRCRMAQVDASIQRSWDMFDTADRQDGEAGELRTAWLTTRLGELGRQMREHEAMEQAVAA